jgi:cytochrome o ubiquinol oxidase subunit IV
MNQIPQVRSYVIGFLLSIVLTLAAYFLAQQHLNAQHQFMTHTMMSVIFIGIAMVQLIVQLGFFLHLGREPRPRWNLVFFIATFSIVLLVVIASIWIMDHLNYNMMPHEMEEFLLKDEGYDDHIKMER